MPGCQEITELQYCGSRFLAYDQIKLLLLLLLSSLFMNTPHVCLRCSRRLFRWECKRRSSGFVSLGHLISHDGDNKPTPPKVPMAYSEPRPTQQPRPKERSIRAQQYQEQGSPKDCDKALETLFASNCDSEKALEKSRYSRTPKPQSIEVRIEELHNQLVRGTASLLHIWKTCEGLLFEKDWHRDSNAPANLEIFRDILLAICRIKRLAVDHREIAPAEAIRIYTEHGAMRHWWHLVLWCQLGNVLQLRYQPGDDSMKKTTDDEINSLLGEIIDVWKLYARRRGVLFRRVPLSGNPREVDTTSAMMSSSSSFPRHMQTEEPDEITVVAAMTIECLTAAGMRVPAHIKSLSNRFSHPLERDRSVATSCLVHAGVSSEITKKALEGWESPPLPEPEILEPTEKLQISRGLKAPIRTSRRRQYLDWNEKGLETCFLDLDGASQRSDAELAMNLWRQFQEHLEADKSNDHAHAIDHLYARFLRTFWALRQYDQAIVAWNYMINSGHRPSQKHWTGMLIGCMRAKDVVSLQSIWNNMLRSGMPPGITTWTTYIHALIECRKWQEGLKALEDLGRIWKLAPPLEISESAADKTTVTNIPDRKSKPKDETILRPSATPINAALSALVQINKPSLLPQVLAWARSHQVPLSTYTFNILLRPLVRRGSQASIQAHFQQMADADCTPDVGTFTIILNGLVSNPASPFHTLPPAMQESTITSILADMGRQGIEPNPFTYGTLLEGLLTQGSSALSHTFEPNVAAARTILAHMDARNIHPSPHIYTILIEHYFKRHPIPDLPAVSSLWSSIQESGRVNYMDNIFFDRLIEGYAKLDETEDAMRFLRLMPEQGMSPGWDALAQVLRALIRARDWGRCGEFVEDVDREGGLLRHGQRRGQTKESARFWEMVDELWEKGLVGDRDAIR